MDSKNPILNFNTALERGSAPIPSLSGEARRPRRPRMDKGHDSRVLKRRIGIRSITEANGKMPLNTMVPSSMQPEQALQHPHQALADQGIAVRLSPMIHLLLLGQGLGGTGLKLIHQR
jgi:hypothetical protein